jgi:Endodeoxyribonuclease RusA
MMKLTFALAFSLLVFCLLFVVSCCCKVLLFAGGWSAQKFKRQQRQNRNQNGYNTINSNYNAISGTRNEYRKATQRYDTPKVVSVVVSEEASQKKKSLKGLLNKSKTRKQHPRLHWIDFTPNVVDTTTTLLDINLTKYILSDDQFNVPALVNFTVRGNPLPLRRHRTARGFVYNPSAAAQESFRSVVKESILQNITMLWNPMNKYHLEEKAYIIDDDDMNPTTYAENERMFPVFASHHQLVMTVVFRMKRPLNQFRASKPGPGRLKAPFNLSHTDSHQYGIPQIKSDIDNLIKFVLDSMNGILYDDDKQIISVHAIKLYDDECSCDENCCLGSTQVCIKTVESQNKLQQIIENM